LGVRQKSQIKTLTINIFQFKTHNSALTNTHYYIVPISMNIVITDGFTLHGSDLAWDCFNSLGKVTFYERTPMADIVERCKEADIVITNKTPFSAETIAALPQLKMIAVAATGYNIIDIQATTAQGIVVSNIPAYGTASVAQHIFALILELSNHVGKNSQAVANGAWTSAQDWCFSLSPIIELAGKP
jgi:glycerate dehydrogenase